MYILSIQTFSRWTHQAREYNATIIEDRAINLRYLWQQRHTKAPEIFIQIMKISFYRLMNLFNSSLLLYNQN